MFFVNVIINLVKGLIDLVIVNNCNLGVRLHLNRDLGSVKD